MVMHRSVPSCLLLSNLILDLLELQERLQGSCCG